MQVLVAALMLTTVASCAASVSFDEIQASLVRFYSPTVGSWHWCTQVRLPSVSAANFKKQAQKSGEMKQECPGSRASRAIGFEKKARSRGRPCAGPPGRAGGHASENRRDSMEMWG